MPVKWVAGSGCRNGFPASAIEYLGNIVEIRSNQDMRESGILMHITSLPGPYGVGTMGKCAYDFVDFLKKSGQSLWQILPLTPTGYGDSPYQSPSTHAGNPYFIDLDILVEDGLLKQSEIDELFWGNDPTLVDYGALYQNRFTLLQKACDRGYERDLEQVTAFEKENANWLHDYALFMAVKKHFGMRCWLDWPDEDIRLRKPEAIAFYTEKLADDKIMLLEGWVPTEIEKDTIAWLENKEIYFEAKEPEKNVDNPPIKLKNRRFARLFEMIGNMYSIPTYWELDMTPFFAPFFVMFFGFCMGDLGYGALICVITLALILSKKLKEMNSILWLGFFLGFGTVIMGTISGTFFGVPLLEVDIPIVNKLKAIMFKPEGIYSAFYVSLIIGVFQILFGMCLKIINMTKLYGFGAAVSTIGWVIMLLGGIVTFLIDGIGIPFYACIITGAVLVYLLNGPINSFAAPFKNIGSGLWDTYNMATGLLGDVLSYIRLFALGLSGSILGLVFNDLAMNMKPDIPVLGTIVMLLILIFGHTMNIALSALSAFVHPMRLTFVEFYKNSGFVGGAKQYEPFKKN